MKYHRLFREWIIYSGRCVVKLDIIEVSVVEILKVKERVSRVSPTNFILFSVNQVTCLGKDSFNKFRKCIRRWNLVSTRDVLFLTIFLWDVMDCLNLKKMLFYKCRVTPKCKLRWSRLSEIKDEIQPQYKSL